MTWLTPAVAAAAAKRSAPALSAFGEAQRIEGVHQVVSRFDPVEGNGKAVCIDNVPEYRLPGTAVATRVSGHRVNGHAEGIEGTAKPRTDEP